MKIAFVTTRLFDEPASGGELCTARLLQALADEGHEVHCFGRGAATAAPRRHVLGPAVEPFDALPRHRRALALVGALARARALTVHRHRTSWATGRLAPLLQAPDGGWDAVIVDHLQTWDWVAPLAPTRPLLVMHNLESEGYLARAREPGAAGPSAFVLRREARLLAKLEASALAGAAGVACLSPDDAAVLRPHAAARVEVLPAYPLRAPVAPRRGTGLRIGAIGTWTWGPNRTALNWLLREVAPHLPSTARLVLAGQGLDGMPVPANVELKGRLASTHAFYADVDVVVAASQYGSGVQEKVVDALGSGRAVIATPHALRGLGDTSPPGVRVAGEGAAFAALCAAPVIADEASAAAREHWAAARRAAYRDALRRWLAGAAGPQ